MIGYINTLIKNNDLLGQVVRFDAFTDIEFNPEKSIIAKHIQLPYWQVCSLKESHTT